VLELGGLRGRRRGGGDRFDSARQHGGDPVTQDRGADAGSGAEVDLVEAALLAEQPLRRRRIEQRQARHSRSVAIAEPGDGADGERPRRTAGDHADPVADVQALAARGGRVDGHRARPGGRMPLAQRVGAGQRGVRRPARRHARPAGDDAAVAADDAGPVADGSLGNGHPWDRADAVEEARRDRPAAGIAPRARRGRGVADHHVGAGGGGVEQAAEAVLDGGGEDQGPGHEGHAQRGRAGAEQQPHAVREQALESCPEHRQPPSRFIRSSTRSGVGSASSPTIRPSARKTTRLA
jgi:hypothetical protein